MTCAFRHMWMKDRARLFLPLIAIVFGSGLIAPGDSFAGQLDGIIKVGDRVVPRDGRFTHFVS